MIQNREALLGPLSEAVRQAGRLFDDRAMAGQIRQKGPTDFVTSVDVSVQALLKTRLAELAPEVQFMGEEQDNVGVDFRRPVWILDPVDGTTNLIHGYRHSAVSLALSDRGRVVLGLVYDPYADELFTAVQGKGARCNGAPIRTSGAQTLAESLVDVGTNPSDRPGADRTFRWMRAVYDRSHDIRRIGAASIALCYVAAGRVDGFVEGGLKPWDYAAGMLLVQEAGGTVSTPEGTPLSLSRGGAVVASNGPIGPELLAVIQGL